MSIIDNVLKANREYSKRHDRKLAQRPAPKEVPVRGFVFDMETGLLTEVDPTAARPVG